MQKFRATKYDGKNIELQGSSQIDDLYAILEKEENFVLEWTSESGEKCSRLMIGTEVFPKIRTGDIILTAKGSNTW